MEPNSREIYIYYNGIITQNNYNVAVPTSSETKQNTEMFNFVNIFNKHTLSPSLSISHIAF